MAQPTLPPGATISSNTATGSFVSIPQTAAAGAIVMTQPPQTGAQSFYKIAPSQPITFGWNFTAVIATPTHLTVSAICDNGNTYPVGPTDGIIPGTATQVVWDVFSYQQANPGNPLAQATYALNIWDDRGPGSPRQGGFLAPFSGLKFALYTPQPYTPIASGWTCTGCNAAMSSMTAHPLFAALLASFFVMLVTGWGVIRRH